MQIIITTLVIICTFLIVPSTCSDDAPIFLNKHAISSAGNFTNDRPFNSSLTKALSNLTFMSASKTFANVTVGSNESSRVYALFSCQHDIPQHVCRTCVETAAFDILDRFYDSPKEAIVTYQECILRYANRMIFSTMEIEPYDTDCSTLKYSDLTEIRTAVNRGFKTLIEQATNSTDLFAVGRVKINKNVVLSHDLYFLVQCTPDITKEQCNVCLLHAFNSTVASCGSDGRLSGQTVGPSCLVRYDEEVFIYTKIASMAEVGAPPMSPPLDLKYDKYDKHKDTLEMVLGIFIIIILIILIFCIKNRVCC